MDGAAMVCEKCMLTFMGVQVAAYFGWSCMGG